MKCVGFSVVLLIAGVAMTTAENNCQLPTYLQNEPNNTDDYWHMHQDSSGRGNKVFVKGDLLTAVSGSIDMMGQQIVDAICTYLEEELEEEEDVPVYFFRSRNDSVDQCVCVQFHQLTPNVIQAKTSLANCSEATDSYECANDSMQKAYWPMIANIPRPHANDAILPACPLMGGFLFTTTKVFTGTQESNGTVEPQCEEFPVPSHLESECTTSEGIRLKFADPSCIPHLGWQMEQQLYCMERWRSKDEDEDGNLYEFALVGEEYFRPRFCMRYSVNDTSQMVLFEDLACPPKGKEPLDLHYINFTLTPKKEGTCDDDLDACDRSELCVEALYAEACQKSCSLCDEEESSTTPCQFGDNVTVSEISGVWSLLEDWGNRSVLINDTHMHIEDFTPLACHSHVTYDTKVLSAQVHPTCSPRYTCAKFGRPGEAVLQYQISQFSSDPSEETLCTGTNFRDDIQTTSDKFRSEHMKTLIDPDALNEGGQVCGLDASFEVILHHYNGDVACTGEAHDCARDKKGINFSGVCDLESANFTETLLEFDCLAKLNFGDYSGSGLLIVKKGTAEAMCLVRNLEPNQGEGFSIYVLESAQCDADTVTDLLRESREYRFRGHATQDMSCDDYLHSTTQVPVPTGTGGTTSTTVPTTSTTPGPATGTSEESTVPEQVQPSPNPDAGLSKAQVLGITVGCLLVVGVLGMIGWWGYREYQVRKQPYRVL